MLLNKGFPKADAVPRALGTGAVVLPQLAALGGDLSRSSAAEQEGPMQACGRGSFDYARDIECSFRFIGEAFPRVGAHAGGLARPYSGRRAQDLDFGREGFSRCWPKAFQAHASGGGAWRGGNKGDQRELAPVIALSGEVAPPFVIATGSSQLKAWKEIWPVAAVFSSENASVDGAIFFQIMGLPGKSFRFRLFPTSL